MEITSNGKRIFSEEEKAGIIERYKGSGLGQREFCKQAGISVTALQSWKRRRGGDEASKFVELPAARAFSEVGQMIELRLPHGIVLRIAGQAI